MMKLDRSVDAGKAYTQAIQLNKYNARPYLFRANAYDAIHRHDLAKQDRQAADYYARNYSQSQFDEL